MVSIATSGESICEPVFVHIDALLNIHCTLSKETSYYKKQRITFLATIN